MRTHRTTLFLPSAFPAVPGALLALTVILCGGSMAEATTAAVLIQQSQERAGQLTRDPEAVASLLGCLGEVGKDAQKRFDGQQAMVTSRAGQVPRLDVVVHATPDAPRATPHAIPLPLTLIDLPPPAAAL